LKEKKMSFEIEPFGDSTQPSGDIYTQPTTPSGEQQKFWGMPANTYCLLMHLSVLLAGAGWGIAIPIVMWAVNKDQSLVIGH
jgi:hypothetical protein